MTFQELLFCKGTISRCKKLRFEKRCHLPFKGQHQNFWEILYIVEIDWGGGKVAYLYKRISLFPLKKGNSAVKIDGGKGSRCLSLQDVYLFPDILMSSLIIVITEANLTNWASKTHTTICEHINLLQNSQIIKLRWPSSSASDSENCWSSEAVLAS